MNQKTTLFISVGGFVSWRGKEEFNSLEVVKNLEKMKCKSLSSILSILSSSLQHFPPARGGQRPAPTWPLIGHLWYSVPSLTNHQSTHLNPNPIRGREGSGVRPPMGGGVFISNWSYSGWGTKYGLAKKKSGVGMVVRSQNTANNNGRWGGNHC